MLATMSNPVVVRREKTVFPTYEPQAPDRNPMFLERRVYQGSSGRVYPLPFYNRIAENPVEREWDSVILENDFIRVMVLPELGGRIHIGQDKTNGYDFFYRQDCIKPALVGLAGPWISGGVEFNWPQHHRPATFMPVDTHLERHPDGSATLWLGDHDPMERMKGMHGVCLHPDSNVIELKMRAHNRTQLTQTFLWWANVATRVHEGYQSFFPQDVSFVADHAKRAMSRFPLCDGHYYGVDYAARGRDGVPAEEVPSAFVPNHCLPPDRRNPAIPDYRPDDLSWYANIPVPTSYMCIGSQEDFSGGYDHLSRAGLVQVSNHHISPGKKQWTWGNHDFGYAWDRNLTDKGGPYIELMLGVYTDNQPDFSFLAPGETKSWSVFWYPIREIGPAHKANERVAASLAADKGKARVGVAFTRRTECVKITLACADTVVKEWIHDGAPDRPFTAEAVLPGRAGAPTLRVFANETQTLLLEHTTPSAKKDHRTSVPAPATEPPAPASIDSADELFVTGLHLSQYRHATRSPVDYWREALRRDPGDARCNNALGLWHLRRGEFAQAEACFRTSIARLTLRNPNPADGEPLYNLGLTLRHQGRDDEAYAAFYKATWNQAWQGASWIALAEIDCTRADWDTALDHLTRALRLDTENLRARNLRVLALRKLGRDEEAECHLSETLALDPLDTWARWLRDSTFMPDDQLRIDLALDLARAGFLSEALSLLEAPARDAMPGAGPLLGYHRAHLLTRSGDHKAALLAAKGAAAQPTDYCFPARLEDLAALQNALELNPKDARAAYYLGNLLYDRRRHAEAIALWERSARLDPSFPTTWRNLGIAYFNVQQKPAKARQAYEKALRADPSDPRLVHERDQLWKRLGLPATRRLAQLTRLQSLVAQRDDASIEQCTLLNQVGLHEEALRLIASRRFQPWEGGEGLVLGQFTRAHLALARKALSEDKPALAVEHASAALHPPEALGEARHLLANASDIHLLLGDALAAARDKDGARRHWTLAADARGDFQEMSVKAYSEMTYHSATALSRLGRKAEARKLLSDLLAYARTLARAKARIDYFATSLPTMLLFEDDLKVRQENTAIFLRAQAEFGLGRRAPALRSLKSLLARDPSHGPAADLLAELEFTGRRTKPARKAGRRL